MKNLQKMEAEEARFVSFAKLFFSQNKMKNLQKIKAEEARIVSFAKLFFS
jgi:hypothetical protein